MKMHATQEPDEGPRAVTVVAPARLHLGFLDLNGGLGRRFGSIGLTISHFVTRVMAVRAPSLEVQGVSAERGRQLAVQVLDLVAAPAAARITIAEEIPAHAGLGSGTQLSLAIAAAITQLYQERVSVAELAAVTQRGQRSGIGIACFEHGGLIVDGGRGPGGTTPPMLARMAVPSAWRVLLVLDDSGAGLSGGAELAAFGSLGPMPEAIAGELCRRTLMQVLPAVAEQDYAAFCEGITAVQELIGSYFAPAQAGLYSSPRVAEAMRRAHALGARGTGQSSWGPTAFAFLPSPGAADDLCRDLRRACADLPGLRFVVVAARNSGAELSHHALSESTSALRPIELGSIQAD